ncbi:hypothetical protein NJ7G_3273 [Natrinema sp. J7-2]|nr:hypothetical protein NJ7G_3273 [Natrinema sp. J7-2]
MWAYALIELYDRDGIKHRRSPLPFPLSPAARTGGSSDESDRGVGS